MVKLLSRRGLRSAELAQAGRISDVERQSAAGGGAMSHPIQAAPKARPSQKQIAATTDPESPDKDRLSSETSPPQNLSPDATKDLVRLFKLLSDATRLRILHFLLQQEELHVRALCELLGQSQPAVSHHLSLLRVAGLIEARRQGKHNFYRLMPNGFQGAMELMSVAVPQWRRR